MLARTSKAFNQAVKKLEDEGFKGASMDEYNPRALFHAGLLPAGATSLLIKREKGAPKGEVAKIHQATGEVTRYEFDFAAHGL